MSYAELGAARWIDRGRRWFSSAAGDALAGGREIAFESDRWFLEALRGIETGALRAQHGIDTVTGKLAAGWERRRPGWLRRRTSRERIESSLRAEAKRHGIDITQEQFRAFSGRMAILLELVYTGAVPVDAIAFEAAGPGVEDLQAPDGAVDEDGTSSGVAS